MSGDLWELWGRLPPALFADGRRMASYTYRRRNCFVCFAVWERHEGEVRPMSYLKFAAMIVTSAAVMYAVMYMSSYQWDHVTFSASRLYMAIAMGATMAVIMMTYMWSMYANKAAKTLILLGGIVLLGIAVYLDRRQVLIEDVAFMRAMIPHHSMAITRSERAGISDPRVRELADQIIESQLEEIAQMKALINELKLINDLNNGSQTR